MNEAFPGANNANNEAVLWKVPGFYSLSLR